jgi:hypothetical protein
LPYTKSVKFVIVERGIMTLVYLPAAAVVAEIAVWSAERFEGLCHNHMEGGETWKKIR